MYEVFRPHEEYRRELLPNFSSDDNAVRSVRNRIEGLGLEKQFSLMLLLFVEVRIGRSTFDVLQATPQQQCIAAILAKQEKERGE